MHSASRRRYGVCDLSTSEYRKIYDSGGRLCLRKKRCRASPADPVAFDCDGVLVDTRGSYDAAIARTVETLLEMRFGCRLPMNDPARRMTFLLRRTGAFNNDWDTSFAIMLFSSIAMLETGGGDVAGRAEELASRFASGTVTDAARDVLSYVGGIEEGAVAGDAAALAEWLSYPGTPPGSLLATVFDELYYGRRGFIECYGEPPRHYSGEGLMGNEKLMFDGDFVRHVTALSGRRPAIITGRPLAGTRMSLGELLSLFDLGSSVFIGDVQDNGWIRKPRPGALLKCMDSMRSGTLVYAGNSAEDLQMSAAAVKRGYSIWFAGVCGSGTDAAAARDYFEAEGADMIIHDISQLPTVLGAANSDVP